MGLKSVTSVSAEYGTEILNAIAQNDLQRLREIIEKRLKTNERIRELFESNVKHKQSRTSACPVILASRLTSPDILRYLFERGVNPNFVYYRDLAGGRKEVVTPLHIAVDLSHYDVVDMLLDSNTNTNIRDHNSETPLLVAVMKADWIMAQMLLAKGADPNVVDKHQNTPLHIASRLGHLQLVRTLIEFNADVNMKGKDGAIPVQIAAREGHVYLLDLFCSTEGTGINTTIQCFDDRREKAAIHVAAAQGHDEAVRRLVDTFGADVNVKDNEWNTPLHYIVLLPYNSRRMRDRKYFTNTARILLERRANPNTKNAYGDTPLHLASMNQFPKIVEILLQYGAKSNAENAEHLKPADIVPPWDHITKQLLKNAARNRKPEKERTDVIGVKDVYYVPVSSVATKTHTDAPTMTVAAATTAAAAAVMAAAAAPVVAAPVGLNLLQPNVVATNESVELSTGQNLIRVNAANNYNSATNNNDQLCTNNSNLMISRNYGVQQVNNDNVQVNRDGRQDYAGKLRAAAHFRNVADSTQANYWRGNEGGGVGRGGGVGPGGGAERWPDVPTQERAQSADFPLLPEPMEFGWKQGFKSSVPHSDPRYSPVSEPPQHHHQQHQPFWSHQQQQQQQLQQQRQQQLQQQRQQQQQQLPRHHENAQSGGNIGIGGWRSGEDGSAGGGGGGWRSGRGVVGEVEDARRWPSAGSLNSCTLSSLSSMHTAWSSVTDNPLKAEMGYQSVRESKTRDHSDQLRRSSRSMTKLHIKTPYPDVNNDDNRHFSDEGELRRQRTRNNSMPGLSGGGTRNRQRTDDLAEVHYRGDSAAVHYPARYAKHSGSSSAAPQRSNDRNLISNVFHGSEVSAHRGQKKCTESISIQDEDDVIRRIAQRNQKYEESSVLSEESGWGDDTAVKSYRGGYGVRTQERNGSDRRGEYELEEISDLEFDAASFASEIVPVPGRRRNEKTTSFRKMNANQERPVKDVPVKPSGNNGYQKSKKERTPPPPVAPKPRLKDTEPLGADLKDNARGMRTASGECLQEIQPYQSNNGSIAVGKIEGSVISSQADIDNKRSPALVQSSNTIDIQYGDQRITISVDPKSATSPAMMSQVTTSGGVLSKHVGGGGGGGAVGGGGVGGGEGKEGKKIKKKKTVKKVLCDDNEDGEEFPPTPGSMRDVLTSSPLPPGGGSKQVRGKKAMVLQKAELPSRPDELEARGEVNLSEENYACKHLREYRTDGVGRSVRTDFE